MRVIVMLGVLAFVAFVLLAGRRFGELFCVSVRRGRLLLIRGRARTGLLQDFADVIRRDSVEHATIRAVRAQGHARLVVSGVAEFTAQRLRNVFGLTPQSKLSTDQPAPKQAGRNLGQILGWAWLAWWLLDRRTPDR